MKNGLNSLGHVPYSVKSLYSFSSLCPYPSIYKYHRHHPHQILAFPDRKYHHSAIYNGGEISICLKHPPPLHLSSGLLLLARWKSLFILITEMFYTLQNW